MNEDKVFIEKITNINIFLLKETLNEKVKDKYIKMKVFEKILEYTRLMTS